MNSENQEKSKNAEKMIGKPREKAIEIMTPEQVMDFIDKNVAMIDDPQYIIRELSKNLLPKFKKNKKYTKKIKEATAKALMAYGLDNHYFLAESVNERYRPLAVEFSRQIVKEFNCITPSEKALAQNIVNAYIETIDSSRRFHNCLAVAEYINDTRTRYLAVISKHLDRANRQFITAFSTLKQIKTPSLEINIKSETAFVAQNQQLNINSDTNNPDKTGEKQE